MNCKPNQILQGFRKSQGLTQKQIAEKIGVTPSYYIKVEQGMAKAGRGFIEMFLDTYPNIDVKRMFFTAEEV